MRLSIVIIFLFTVGFFINDCNDKFQSVKESCVEVIKDHGGQILHKSIYRQKVSGRVILNDERSTFLCLTENHKAVTLLVDDKVVWRQ